jgi:hypothetical protein
VKANQAHRQNHRPGVNDLVSECPTERAKQQLEAVGANGDDEGL